MLSYVSSLFKPSLLSFLKTILDWKKRRAEKYFILGSVTETKPQATGDDS